MKAVGKVLLTGAAVIVLWKVIAGIFVGLLAMALKVALVILGVYLLLQLFNGRRRQE